MIMVGAIRLDMGVVPIKTQLASTAQRLVVPSRTPVVLPELRRTRVHDHTVYRNAKNRPLCPGCAGVLLRTRGTFRL